VAEQLPLFPLGTVLFPGSPMPLHVFEPRYRQLVEDLLSGPEPRAFGIVAIREGHEVGADNVRALYDVGCVAELRQLEKAQDGRFALLVVGTRRFRLRDVDRARPYLRADVELVDEPPGDSSALEDAERRVRQAFPDYSSLLQGAMAPAELPAGPTELSYAVAARLVVDLPERQLLLEAPDTADRLRIAADLMAREVALTRGLRAVPMPAPPVPRHRLN
jgi:Lon protease-like protein